MMTNQRTILLILNCSLLCPNTSLKILFLNARIVCGSLDILSPTKKSDWVSNFCKQGTPVIPTDVQPRTSVVFRSLHHNVIIDLDSLAFRLRRSCPRSQFAVLWTTLTNSHTGNMQLAGQAKTPTAKLRPASQSDKHGFTCLIHSEKLRCRHVSVPHRKLRSSGGGVANVLQAAVFVILDKQTPWWSGQYYTSGVQISTQGPPILRFLVVFLSSFMQMPV
jgi:hypothetical protein